MQTVHASAVAVDGKGVLIRGASGAGKSSIALGMISHGATLIADDQVVLTANKGVWLSAPDPLKGLIEARQTGLLRAPTAEAPLALVVDLDQIETQRLPPWRKADVMGMEFPLVHKSTTPLFPYILVHYVTHGRQE